MPPKWYPKVLPGTVADWVAPVRSVALARSVYDPGLGVRHRNSHRCQAAGALGSRGMAGCQCRPPSVLISVRVNGPTARPGPPGEQVLLVCGQPRVPVEFERAPDRLGGDERSAGRVSLPEQPVGLGVPVGDQGSGGDLDLAHPLDARYPGPVRHDDPHRVPVVGRQRFSIHLIRQDHVVQRLGYGDRPPHPPVADRGHDEVRIKPGRHDVHRLAGDPRPLQDDGQRDAAPGRHPDRAQPPGRAGHRLALLGSKEAPAVARALDRADHGAGPQVQQVLVAEPHRPARRNRTLQTGAEHARLQDPASIRGVDV